ncbi:hypothetical protein T265_06427 [Opisthorchis viverrini]|uniref:Uncharacterized protein n=1 Tax=Opisthorchis viverrini TaxID=6198 RepID=A0A074ZSH1_OPIVI|nr:hypothetical protein T265_06427 [Opisthorchis viverrini]KER26310.1 hypothetical protein T265_06427 [Opisthorchis viverrini]
MSSSYGLVSLLLAVAICFADVVVYLTASELTPKQMYTGFFAEQQGYGEKEVLTILDKELESMASSELYQYFGTKDLLWFDYDQENRDLHGVLGLMLDGDPTYITRTWMSNKHFRILDMLRAFGATTSSCPLAIKVKGQTSGKCTGSEATVVVDLETSKTADLTPDTSDFADAQAALVAAITDKSNSMTGEITVHHFVGFGSAGKKSGSATACVNVGNGYKINPYKKQFDTIKKLKRAYTDQCSVNIAWISGPGYVAVASAKMPSGKSALAAFMQTQVQGSPQLFIAPYLCEELLGCKGQKKKALVSCVVKNYELEEEKAIIEAQLIITVDSSKLSADGTQWPDVSDWAVASYVRGKGKDVDINLYEESTDQHAVKIYSGPPTDQYRKLLFQVSACESGRSKICSKVNEMFEGSLCTFIEEHEEFEDCTTNVYHVDIPVVHFSWVNRVAEPWKVILRFQEKLTGDSNEFYNVGFRNKEEETACD